MTAPQRRWFRFSLRKLFVVVTMLASSITECGSPSDSRLVGTWDGQFTPEAIEKLTEVAQRQFGESRATPDDKIGATARKTFAAAKVEREYRSDGMMKMLTMGEELHGTWRYLDGSKHQYVWDAESPLEVTIDFDGPDRFSEASDESGPATIFCRRKPVDVG